MRFGFVFSVWLFTVGTARATPKRIAVLEFRLEPEDTKLRKMLEDEIRAGLLEFSNPRELEILNRLETETFLAKRKPKQSCTLGECERLAAQLLRADYVVSGDMSKHDDDWYIFLKIFRGKDGTILGSHRLRGKSEWELLQRLKDESYSLYGRLPVQVERMFPSETESSSPVLPKIPAVDIEKASKAEDAESLAIEEEESSDTEAEEEEAFDEEVQFNLLSIQCRRKRSGFVPVGYCHEGNFLGMFHTGWLIRSEIDENFFGFYQISLLNESGSFYGFMQVGLVNETHRFQIGGQIGLVNSTGEIFGGQIGIVNRGKQVYGLQIGLINHAESLRGVQVGLLNIANNSVFPVMIGINIGI
ncbi:MAG: hypothetical protein VX278_08725 [Myxococcota bacterium]|nr:hypothetical protein [Myxococcota bacterium]